MRVRPFFHVARWIGVFIVTGAPTVVYAQTDSLSLTVHPHALHLGTQTLRAGRSSLPNLAGYAVYVPTQCVGTRRCPLVVFLHPGAENADFVVTHWTPVSDTYGTILLAPNSPHDRWNQEDQKNLNAAMTQVLQQFAIDTTRIALIGYSHSGPVVIAFGGHRLDVFQRVILASTDGDEPASGVDATNTTAQFLVVFAQEEARGFFRNVQSLRHAGHPVTSVLELRDHEMHPSDYDLMGRWLEHSWTRSATRLPSQVVPPMLPTLTTDMLTKLTTFWTRFVNEPDSIQAVRRAHLQAVVVPVGDERPSIPLADIPMLAAKYPSVAADLTAAGLTPEQHDMYRVAFLSAVTADYAIHGMKFTGFIGPDGKPFPVPQAMIDKINSDNASGPSPITLPAGSVQEKNMTFIREHAKERAALERTNILYVQ